MFGARKPKFKIPVEIEEEQNKKINVIG